jgi:hypothetical protein
LTLTTDVSPAATVAVAVPVKRVFFLSLTLMRRVAVQLPGVTAHVMLSGTLPVTTFGFFAIATDPSDVVPGLVVPGLVVPGLVGPGLVGPGAVGVGVVGEGDPEVDVGANCPGPTGVPRTPVGSGRQRRPEQRALR